MRKALLIGINDYPSAPLGGCLDDAHAMNACLMTHGDGSPNFSTRIITSPSQTISRGSLKEAIVELFSSDPDLALFYFSGHGLLNSIGGYVVTPDYSKYDEGVSMTEILKIANASKARDKIIILDCCHSGAMGTPSIDGSMAAALTEGLTVLTACRSSEVALEGTTGGLFTSLVVNALQGGAADLRGHITPGSVYAYVDQALGPWDQRPIFKTNITKFTSLRQLQPAIPLEILREICTHFPTPQDEHKLDPSYEHSDAAADDDNVRIFKILQKYEGVNLVIPVDEEHMYYAAMKSKSCRLTALGHHYWRLVKDGKI